jgi:hypothetical protein
MGSRESLDSNEMFDNEAEYQERLLDQYGNASTPTYRPLPMPKPLTAGSTAAKIGPAGIDVFGMPSRPNTENGQMLENDILSSTNQPVRPSTSERAIPFQFQLASIQAAKTAEHVREEEAAVAYGLAVNRLADMQSDKLVEKELQSQHLLSHPYD